MSTAVRTRGSGRWKRAPHERLEKGLKEFSELTVIQLAFLYSSSPQRLAACAAAIVAVPIELPSRNTLAASL